MSRVNFGFIVVFVLLSLTGTAVQGRTPQAYATSGSNSSASFWAAVDWERLAAIEQIVNRRIAKDQRGAEKLLSRIKAEFDQPAYLMQVHPAQTMPRVTALVGRLGGKSSHFKVAGPEHPVVKAGLAAMVVDDVMYASTQLEQNARDEKVLLAVVAHEMGHDRMDAVRKRLNQDIANISPDEILWLNARLETRAHINGMKLLAGAGYNPTLILDYVKKMVPHEFTSDHMKYIAISVEGALQDIAIVSGNGPR